MYTLSSSNWTLNVHSSFGLCLHINWAMYPGRYNSWHPKYWIYIYILNVEIFLRPKELSDNTKYFLQLIFHSCLFVLFITSSCVCDLYAHMTAFQRKLDLFKEGSSSHPLILTHFPTCEEMKKNVPQCQKLLHKYKADTDRLKHCFQNFHTLQPQIMLTVDPLSAAVSEQSYTGKCSQICFFKWGAVFLGGNLHSPLPNKVPFSLPPRVCTLNDQYVWSMYICESSFSTMKHIKSKERAHRLMDETLFHLMQIGCTKIDIDIQSIVHQQANPLIKREPVGPLMIVVM